MTRRRGVLRWELAGSVFMIIVGSALHFVFGWTGGWRPAALIAAVNESIWEHLKLAFWPGVIWMALTYRPSGILLQKIVAAKGVSLFVTSVLITVIFRSYTHILGRNLLPLDIGTFVIAVFAGQALSYQLLIRDLPRVARRAGIGLFVIQLVAFSLFTFWPPDQWLFVDSRNGLRGIPPF